MSSAAATARRAQIVAATIDTIAEVGYRRTTFARIAERGGLSSTRLISYHFSSKDTLVKAVVTEVFRLIDQFLVDWTSEHPASRPLQVPPGTAVAPPGGRASDELRAYLTGVIAFVDGHRVQMCALQSIFAALHDDEGNAAAYGSETDRAVLGHLEEILRRGQRSGEFRAFDTLVMAAAIQRPLERLPLLLRSEPNLDLRRYADEVVTLFDLATRAS